MRAEILEIFFQEFCRILVEVLEKFQDEYYEILQMSHRNWSWNPDGIVAEFVAGIKV